VAGETFLVTGANRGIGLEYARQLCERGDRVIATARAPEKARALSVLPLRVERLDVADAASVAELARRLAGVPLDVLIHNAGIGEAGPPLETLSMEDVEHACRVNAVGPLRLTQALLPNLRAGKRRLVIGMTSGLGSISRNESGGWYAYRASKAALNQLFRTMAEELEKERFIFVVLCPGWVQTDMGGPGAPTSVEDSVRGLLKVIDGLKPSDTSRFLNHRGKEVAW
jgi:NAD(P)-dependent dehydrogenase (short-subunit alcohol dehydrogenase family)